ncbi:hypothetical protein ABKN59_009755 [Abortiporus biennis]
MVENMASGMGMGTEAEDGNEMKSGTSNLKLEGKPNLYYLSTFFSLIDFRTFQLSLIIDDPPLNILSRTLKTENISMIINGQRRRLRKSYGRCGLIIGLKQTFKLGPQAIFICDCLSSLSELYWSAEILRLGTC